MRLMRRKKGVRGQRSNDQGKQNMMEPPHPLPRKSQEETGSRNVAPLHAVSLPSEASCGEGIAGFVRGPNVTFPPTEAPQTEESCPVSFASEVYVLHVVICKSMPATVGIRTKTFSVAASSLEEFPN